MSVLAVLFGDTHANSLAGLCPPRIQLDERCHYANDIQTWYWSQWLSLWEKTVPQEAERLGADETWAFCIGDGADDNWHSKAGLISLLEHDIVAIGLAVMEPVMQRCDKLFWFRGTPAHTREYGALEELMAMQLGDKVVPAPQGLGRKTWWCGFINCEDCLLYCAHRARSYAYRAWTRGGGVNRSTVHLATQTAFKPEYAPYSTRLAFWAHGHYAAQSTVDACGWRGHFCPPWQARTSYGYALGESTIDAPGAWLAYLEDGEATVWLKQYPLPRGRVWHDAA